MLLANRLTPTANRNLELQYGCSKSSDFELAYCLTLTGLTLNLKL